MRTPENVLFLAGARDGRDFAPEIEHAFGFRFAKTDFPRETLPVEAHGHVEFLLLVVRLR